MIWVWSELWLCSAYTLYILQCEGTHENSLVPSSAQRPIKTVRHTSSDFLTCLLSISRKCTIPMWFVACDLSLTNVKIHNVCLIISLMMYIINHTPEFQIFLLCIQITLTHNSMCWHMYNWHM